MVGEQVLERGALARGVEGEPLIGESDHQEAVGLQDPAPFDQCADRVGQVLQDVVGHDEVEGLIRDRRERLAVADDVRNAATGMHALDRLRRKPVGVEHACRVRDRQRIRERADLQSLPAKEPGEGCSLTDPRPLHNIDDCNRRSDSRATHLVAYSRPMREIEDALPGADLIREGLRDLENGVETVAALLVLVGAPRLRELGIEVVDPFRRGEFPEHRLYDRLAADEGDGAHSSYNALIRRLVSFERTAECVSD